MEVLQLTSLGKEVAGLWREVQAWRDASQYCNLACFVLSAMQSRQIGVVAVWLHAMLAFQHTEMRVQLCLRCFSTVEKPPVPSEKRLGASRNRIGVVHAPFRNWSPVVPPVASQFTLWTIVRNKDVKNVNILTSWVNLEKEIFAWLAKKVLALHKNPQINYFVYQSARLNPSQMCPEHIFTPCLK